MTDPGHSGTSIRTKNDGVFDLLNPRAADVRLADIAHGLANINRFTGQAPANHTVLDHSVHVYRIVRSLGGTDEEQAQALLHDAQETYVGDVSAPLKRAMRPLYKDGSRGQSAYDLIEDRVQQAVFDHFQVEWPIFSPLIKEADQMAYAWEVKALWGIELVAYPLPTVKPLTGGKQRKIDFFTALVGELTGIHT
jgi:5'-deoxynucleotidase YfbR-like HD superfamily hydrolase